MAMLCFEEGPHPAEKVDGLLQTVVQFFKARRKGGDPVISGDAATDGADIQLCHGLWLYGRLGGGLSQ